MYRHQNKIATRASPYVANTQDTEIQATTFTDIILCSHHNRFKPGQSIPMFRKGPGDHSIQVMLLKNTYAASHNNSEDTSANGFHDIGGVLDKATHLPPYDYDFLRFPLPSTIINQLHIHW